MKINIEKVVREFIIRIDGLNFSVKARVSETLTRVDAGKFYWSISHYYSPKENGHTQFPGVHTTLTVEDAETILMTYLKGFTTYGIQCNQDY